MLIGKTYFTPTTPAEAIWLDVVLL